MFLTIQRNGCDEPVTPLIQAENSTHLLLSNSRLQIQLSKRTSFPATYCQQLSDGHFQLGYGNVAPPADEEFLKITVRPDGTIDILRDVRATLPVFYGYSDNRFILSNDYGTVVKGLPRLTLNTDDIVLTLAPRRFYWPTLWNEVGVLRSGETLHAGLGNPPIKSVLYARTWEASDDLPPSDPEEFLPRLENTIARHFETYCPLPNDTPPGFEVSGGLDSSTLLLYYAQAYPDSTWHGMSIFYAPLQEVTQANKLHAILTYAPNGTIDLLKTDRLYSRATAKFTAPDAPPFHPYVSTAIDGLDDIARTFAKAEVTSVFRGSGGDELFDHNITANGQLDIGKESFQHHLKQLPNFLTDRFRNHFHTLNDDNTRHTLPRVSTGVAGSDPMVNPYIEHGIWPVSPFVDSDFYTYCQGLPYKFKNDKHILRAYYRAKNWPEVLYGGTYPNEYPEGELEKPFLSGEFAQIIEEYAGSSVLGRLGYVDTTQLLQTYHDIQKGTRDYEPGMFCLRLWLNLEFNLQLAQQSGQWQPE